MITMAMKNGIVPWNTSLMLPSRRTPWITYSVIPTGGLSSEISHISTMKTPKNTGSIPAARLQPALPVPMVDDITCGVRQAELLVRSGYPKPATGSYAAPGVREMVNVAPEIGAMFRSPA
jgi:hypothetical protein